MGNTSTFFIALNVVQCKNACSFHQVDPGHHLTSHEESASGDGAVLSLIGKHNIEIEMFGLYEGT